MIPTPAANAPRLELPDDEVAREYEELSELEDLDAMPRTGDEGAPLEPARALARTRDELEELAALDDEGFAAVRIAEGERHEDRAARRYEGMDVDELDALAHWDEDAESRAVPDDEIGRGLEAEAWGA